MAFSYPDSESEFVDQVQSDLKYFLKGNSYDSVLVFPPVNSYYRYLIHQVAEKNFVDQLRTFSIGEDPDRRIVACSREFVTRLDSREHASELNVKAVVETSPSSSQHTMVVANPEPTNQTLGKKSRSSLPTIGIYRPPAARRSGEETSKRASVVETQPETQPVVDEHQKEPTQPVRTRVRRPDLQVYVPRARRLAEEPTKNEETPGVPRSLADLESSHLYSNQSRDPPHDSPRVQTQLILEERKTSKRRSSSPTCTPPSLTHRASHLVETKKKLCQPTLLSDLDCEGNERTCGREDHTSSSTMPPVGKMNAAATPQANLPPRAEVLVEKKKKLCQSNSLSDELKCKIGENSDKPDDLATGSTSSESNRRTALSVMNRKFKELKSRELEGSSGECASVISKVTVSEFNKVVNEKVTPVENCADDNNYCDINMSLNPGATKSVHESTTNVESVKEESESKKCDQGADVSDDEYQVSDSGGKSNGLSEMSDRSSGSNESLSSGDSVNSPVVPVQLVKPVKPDSPKKSPSKPARIFNPDECDWDALIDDDGECLDPFLMKELTDAVGQVRVSQPQSDYRNYRSQVPADHYKNRRSTTNEDFGHVVEIHSFPREFKTNDLVAVFMPFKNSGGGFEIKWVDDTHALGVFASALVAEQVLEYRHPMVRTRPLSEATLESRLKARRLAESIQSFRPRPETCAALARRLVSGALGVRLATARQEREEEKRVLQEAREKRKLAAKQREDIWNSG